MDRASVWSDVNPAKGVSRDGTMMAIGGFSGMRKRSPFREIVLVALLLLVEAGKRLGRIAYSGSSSMGCRPAS